VEYGASPEPDASPVFSKAKGLKSKATETKGKKGAAKTASKPMFTMESPEPTPTVEAEDPWTFTPVPSNVKKSQPAVAEHKANTKVSNFSNWWSTNDDAEKEEETPIAEPEPVSVSPEVSGWSSKVTKPKTKKTTKAETVIPEFADEVFEIPAPAPTPAPAPVASAWGKPKKAAKATNAWSAFPASPEEKEEETYTPVPEPAPVSVADNAEDDWWAAAKARKAKKGGNTQEVAKPASKNSWSVVEPESEQKEDDDLAANLAATLEQEDKAEEQPEADANTAEKDSALKAAAKANNNNNNKAGNKKKKGKR
jgi:hypothetical protein